MAVGGARQGAGRPKGRTNSVTAKAREAAAETGLLPHEWLLKVSRGEGIEHKRWKIVYDKSGKEKGRELVTEELYADFPTRLDAAKAAAPFYAPKLATQTVSVTNTSDAVADTLKEIAKVLPV
jgi:hypothetical protein